MKRTVLYTFISILFSYFAYSQNYIQQYPINAIIDNSGNQNRVIFSVFDSVLVAYQYYYTPYYQTNLLLKNNNGAFVGYNATSPGLEDSVYGYIIYDHLIHQFNAVEKFHSDVNQPSAYVYANNAGVLFNIYNTLTSYQQTTAAKYDLNQHIWKTISTQLDTDWDMTPISTWSMAFSSTDFQVGEGFRHIFDPSIAAFKTGSVGCDFGSNFSSVDDYFKYDSGPCEQDGILTYNAEFHTWQYYGPNVSSYGSMYRGIFIGNSTIIPFHNYFAYYDEQLNLWQVDTLFHLLNGAFLIKDRIISFIDNTTNGTSIQCITYDLLTHSFKKDSIAASGANSLSIQDGTVSWSDTIGTHIRGYNDSLGWGNYPTTIVPEFYLTDLYAQTGLPIIHVRNYTIGTDSIIYDFGDGITSVNNGHVLWHQYNGSGPYIVTISDKTGVFISSQTVSFPCMISSNIQNSCSQLCNGSIEIIPPSASSNYSVIWNNGSTNIIIDSLCAGFYSYTFTDTAGCSKTNTIEITEPSLQVISNIGCKDSCSGSLAVYYSGGPGQTTYLWNTGDTLPYLLNSCPGIYSLIITSANQCIDTVSALLDNPFAMNAIVVSPYCYNQTGGSSILINTTGGTPPFDYYWTYPGFSANPLIDEGAGNFELYLSDANGCVDTFNIVVPNPPQINISSLSTDPTCFGCSDGIIALTILYATPPYNITWTPNIGSLSGDSIINLPAGNYNIHVIDSNICDRYYSDTLFQFVSISELIIFESATLSPNPANDKVVISFNSPLLNNYTLQINDALGKTIFTKEIYEGTKQTEIEISNLTPAIYFINFKGKGLNYYRGKLVKY